MNRSSVILRRARDILKTEGRSTLFKRSFDFMTSWLFKQDSFYLYEHTIRERGEADFMPEITDFNFRIVRNNDEAEDLAKTMGFDFRGQLWHSRERLDKGAIAFCIFTEGELAHIGWVALNEMAKKSLDPHPYNVDFAHGQACTGGTFTPPKYRGKGLMTYGYFKRFEFLRENGFATSRNVVSTRNVASQKAHAKFAPRKLARARYLRLLWWESWKETPTA